MIQLSEKSEKLNLHDSSFFECSATAGPITVKLRFEREKPRQSGDGFILVSQEEDIEVDAVEGLDIFRFQVTL